MSDDRKKPFGGKGGRSAGPGKRTGGKPGIGPRKPHAATADGQSRTAASGKPKFRPEGGKRPDKSGFARRDDRARPPRDQGAPRDRDAAPRAAASDASEGKPRFSRDAKPRFERAGSRPDKPGFAKREDRARPPREQGAPRARDAAQRGAAREGRPRFSRDAIPGSGGDRPRPAPRPQGQDGGGQRAPRARAEDAVAAESGERIAKRLARVGIASRRDAEELIAAGRVKVNGQVLTSPAFNVRHNDRIELDGTEIPPIERTRLFLFNKPSGVVTTSRDPEGRRTVFDVLPAGLPRLITVGRLDINTEGLLLLTNDGGLARVLELPATGWLRRYRVRVHGKVEQATLDGLKDGIAVDGVFYGSIEASLDREQGSNAWLTLGLREGKNREVKNILGALGLEVSRLIRISFGPFQLAELGEGQVLEVKGRTLRDQLGERLIEESGANFEADITVPFSNKPVRAARPPAVAEPERPRRQRDGLGVPGEGGLIKKRRFDKQDQRQQALGRLSTKPAGKPRGRKGDREEQVPEPKRARSANVWMAPGARPQGKSRVDTEPARGAEGRPPRGKAAAGAKPDAPGGQGRPPRAPFKGDRPERPARPGKPGTRGGRGDADRRR